MIPLSANTFMVDNSMIDLITTCPWLSYAGIIRRRRPAADSAALRFGGFVHEALALRYRGASLDDQINLVQRLFAANPIDVEGWRNCDSAVKTLHAYAEFWKNEFDDLTIETNPTTGLPYVEQQFAIDTRATVRGRRIIYCGKIDAKLRRRDGLRFTMDHKTSSVLGDRNFWESEAVSAQHPGYVWADRECFGDEATGFIVNALGIRESVLNCEVVEGVVIPGLTATGKPSKAVPIEFQRQQFYTKVPEGQLDEWFENMLQICDRFLYNVDHDSFPRYRVQCVRKYGLCQFYEVCALPAASREAALMSGAFAENTWTPLYTGKDKNEVHQRDTNGTA